MLNVRSFLSSLKLSWLKRLMEDSTWKEFTMNIIPELKMLHNFGIEYANTLIQSIENPFWKDVLKHYKKMATKCCPVSVDEFVSECIHYNPNILRGKKPVVLQEWSNNSIFFIKQLINDHDDFMNYNEFCNKYPDVRTNFLTYAGILNAVKSYSRKMNMTITSRYKCLDNKIWHCIKKGNKAVQKILNENIASPTCVPKWNNLFENLNWEDIFSHCYKTTIDPQLRWFHIRLLHRLLPTQRFLFLRNIVDSPLCNFCQQEEQSITHLFYDCDIVRQFWMQFHAQLRDKCQHVENFHFDKELIIFGTKTNIKNDQVIDLMVLLAKFYIYKCKLQNVNPDFRVFLVHLKNRHVTEQYASSVNGNRYDFDLKWFVYLPLFN